MLYALCFSLLIRMLINCQKQQQARKEEASPSRGVVASNKTESGNEK
jgi:hypothetical protein